MVCVNLKLDVSLKEFSNMQLSVCSFKNTYANNLIEDDDLFGGSK